ncbi:hypothetical protein [Sphingobacterium alimentarium]|uniref:hypothetical protein n=1 Tax=Sphingobacterium alimentarium TaxID=797292 RepID=UPI00104B8D6F|nr:hypothetical protein [Sphingobacterium alimentarium]
MMRLFVAFVFPICLIKSSQLIENAYNLLNENGLIYISFVGEAEASGFKVVYGGVFTSIITIWTP